MSCQSPQIANQYRTFDFIHVCHIPVIPLGFSRHWHCAKCISDPHERTHTKRSAKIVGVIVWLVIAALCSLLFSLQRRLGFLFAAIFFAVLAVVFVVLTVRHQPGPRLADELLTLPPLDEEHCYYCGGDLWGMPLQCVDCHLYQL